MCALHFTVYKAPSDRYTWFLRLKQVSLSVKQQKLGRDSRLHGCLHPVPSLLPMGPLEREGQALRGIARCPRPALWKPNLRRDGGRRLPGRKQDGPSSPPLLPQPYLKTSQNGAVS